jgi:hypothetical protein
VWKSLSSEFPIIGDTCVSLTIDKTYTICVQLGYITYSNRYNNRRGSVVVHGYNDAPLDMSSNEPHHQSFYA